jgi:hypothetical protein
VLRPARARARATSPGSAVRDARAVLRRAALRAPRLARRDADHPAHGVLPQRAHRLLHEGEANHVHDAQANRLDHVRLVPDILLLVHEHDRALGRELREPRAHRRRRRPRVALCGSFEPAVVCAAKNKGSACFSSTSATSNGAAGEAVSSARMPFSRVVAVVTDVPFVG